MNTQINIYLYIYSHCTIKVYSSLPQYTHKFITTDWVNLYAFVGKHDDQQYHQEKHTPSIKPGDALLIRGFCHISSETEQWGKKSKRKNKKGIMQYIKGHKASRPEDIYYEGVFEFSGTSSKHLMVSYNHKANDLLVYIPAIAPLRGFALPTACKLIKIKETVAFLRLMMQLQQSKHKPLTFSSQYSYDINQHLMPEPTDDDNGSNDKDNANDNDGNNDEDNANDNDDIENDIDDEHNNKEANVPKQYEFSDEKVTTDFCEEQNHRFFSKDFDRSRAIRKKMQTAQKIVKRSKTKALNSKKINHKTPVSFATKVIFCRKVEGGMTNKAAWIWMKQHGFNVGKSWQNCHRWSQKGSGYWINKIAVSGNAEKFGLQHTYIHFHQFILLLLHTYIQSTCSMLFTIRKD